MKNLLRSIYLDALHNISLHASGDAGERCAASPSAFCQTRLSSSTQSRYTLSVPFGASAAVIIAACGLAYGLNLARILRPAAMLATRSDYVESALWSGASSLRVFFTHIVPNTVPVLCVQLSMSAGTSLLAEAGLTYLGVGVGAGVPSWGHSLATSVKFISIYPMAVVWPGLVVTLMVITLNLFGDALRDAIDPLTNPALRQSEATHVESEERA